MIRAVFFDVYGTLITAGDVAQVYQRILTDHGHAASHAEVAQWMEAARHATSQLPSGVGEDFAVDAFAASHKREAQIQALLRCAGLDEGCGPCAEGLRDSWSGREVFRLYPEVRAVLESLQSAGVHIGAVSNWEPRLPELLRSHGIEDFFDFILSSEAAGVAKPSLRLFGMALERSGVPAGQTVHVGDQRIDDVQGAESSGIAAVLIRRGEEGPAPHSPCIATLEQLLPLVKSSGWLRGRVVAGKAEAGTFTQLDWVQAQLRAHLGFSNYPGTLNLRLETAEQAALWREARTRPGIPIKPPAGYCAARCYPVSIEGRIRGAIVVPEVGGYPGDVVEVVAPVRLRDALFLEDGSAVTLALM